MKKYVIGGCLCVAGLIANAQTYDTQFTRPLGTVLDEVATRFGVRLKYDVDTVGKVLPYADFRIRPYSVEETLSNILAPFDYKFVKQNERTYKIKYYEYYRRTDADGEKMLSYLSGLYSDKEAFELRKDSVQRYVRSLHGLYVALATCCAHPFVMWI